MNAASNLAAKFLGEENRPLTQGTANPSKDVEKWADTTTPMVALTWEGKNSVKMSNSYKPKILDDRDVIVKVTGSTVCGSDLHLYHGAVMQMQNGDILGHEFCGVVDKIAPGVQGLKEGDRVVASFQIACGNCRFCKQGLSSTCEKTNGSNMQNAMLGNRTAGIFGYSHLLGGFGGGQAEFVRVPFGDVNLLKIPDGVPDEKALYLSDVLCTSYHTVKMTKVQKGETVAIWGMGPIGLMAAIFAQREGAARIIGIDNNWRLDFAKSKIPNLETINFSDLPKGQTVHSKLLEMCPGGIDVCLECAAGEYPKSLIHKAEIMVGLETDTSELLNEMITSARAWGRCGVTGVYSGFTNHFNIGSMMERGVSLIGCGQAPCHRYWKELLDMIVSGDLDPTVMVTHRFALEDTDKVYKLFDKRDPKDAIMKVFLQTKYSPPAAPGTPQLTRL